MLFNKYVNKCTVNVTGVHNHNVVLLQHDQIGYKYIPIKKKTCAHKISCRS